jgi:hypothetical protein
VSEFHNYLVLTDCPVDKIVAAVRSELLVTRKWEEVSAETPGARFIEIWRGSPALTVVELISEMEPDPALGKALSLACNTPVALHFYHSTSGVRQNLAFANGKKIAVGKSPFSELAKNDAWGELVPEGPVLTLSFRDAKSERVEQVMVLVRELFEPVLHELAMKPAKILANHPTIDSAIGYALDVGDGARVFVRYTFPKDGAFVIGQDIWRESGQKYDSISSEEKTQFVPDGDPAQLPALLLRECALLAARFVRQGASKIEEAVPAVRAQIDAARRGNVWQRVGAALEDLERRRNVARDREPGWVAGSVVFKGAQLVMVEVAGLPRFTFRFDTAGLPEIKEVAVGELWESWAGTVGARKLRIGDAVLAFGYDAKFIGRGAA